MAEIMTNDRTKNGAKNKPKAATLRADFTPMVDMNMLLITFFMFCTTLSIPQVMDIAMPAKAVTENAPLTPESLTITALLGSDNKIYFYNGKPDYNNYTSLKEVDIVGFRNMLLNRNSTSINEIRTLKQQLFTKQITKEQFKEKTDAIKKDKKGLNIIIKPTETSQYKNLVDVLDEMQICGIGRYMIVDIEKEDRFLLDNYMTKGTLTSYLNN